MSQVPLAPPTPTGGPNDGWLFLLWQRVTAAGQILWSSITPSTSADVAAVVTDETGSPGSLVFSGNPTLQGVTVDGLAYFGDTTAPAGVTVLNSLISTDTALGNNLALRKCFTGANNPSLVFLKSRGSAASPSIITSFDNLGGFAASGFDGANYVSSGAFLFSSEGTISTGVVPGNIQLRTANSAGTITEGMRITSAKVVTFGGADTAPALKVVPDATPSTQRHVLITAGAAAGNPTIGVSGGILAISASVAITGVVSTSGYTVATLPAGTVGDRAYVTDALAPAYGVAVAGGGAVTIPVFYNGAAWICA